MTRKHVVISGVGRSGTTFLVQLLTRLGLESGYTVGEMEQRLNKAARAGLEHSILEDDCPYLVKSPHFCVQAAEVLKRSDIVIEHVLIPMRDVHAAAESRRHVTRTAHAEWSPIKRFVKKMLRRDGVVGGAPADPAAEANLEKILTDRLYALILALSESFVPVTLLRYPRIVTDERYLYEKLKPILGNRSYDEFHVAFQSTARPDLINNFGETAPGH